MKTASSTTNLIACITIVVAFTLGFASGPATAQVSSSRESGEFEFAFAFSPSELESAPAAEMLLARLESRVRDFCTPDGRITSDQHNQARACVAETMQRVIPKFASATLAEAHNLRAGG